MAQFFLRMNSQVFLCLYISMKAKMLYYCELCGTPYNAKKDALECEKYHKIPQKVVRKNLSYKPKGVGPAWPFRIRVEDGKGSSCQYVYDDKEK